MEQINIIAAIKMGALSNLIHLFQMTPVIPTKHGSIN